MSYSWSGEIYNECLAQNGGDSATDRALIECIANQQAARSHEYARTIGLVLSGILIFAMQVRLDARVVRWVLFAYGLLLSLC